jgi:D-arabinose 1-dehydrogenase-like Zn-dependent alcohol dehydrogenase
MKTYLIREFGSPLVEEVLPDPVPEERQVVVSVQSCGLCHSDLHINDGYLTLGASGKLTLPDIGAELPITMGHEIYGHISDFGPDSGLSDADRGRAVIVYPWIGCGECAGCKAGYDNHCIRPQNLGLQRAGGYGEKVIVRDAKYLIDASGVDPILGGIYACSGITAFSALEKVPARNEWVGLIGVGGVGLMALAIAKGTGFEKVAAIDIDDDRLALATREYGADLAVNSTKGEPASELLARTGGLSAVVDFVGSTATANLAVSVLAPGGTYVTVGLFGGEITVPLPVLALRELSVRGSFVGTLDELQRLIDHIRSGRIKPIPVTSASFGSVNESLDALRHGRVQGRRVLIHDDV